MNETETKSKYTPGPWKVASSGIQVLALAPDRIVHPLATMHEGYFGTGASEANAHLIAASPALLEALKLAEMAMRHAEVWLGEDITLAPALIEAQAAIALAEQPS